MGLPLEMDVCSALLERTWALCVVGRANVGPLSRLSSLGALLSIGDKMGLETRQAHLPDCGPFCWVSSKVQLLGAVLNEPH